jgi:hypothetical protein
MKSIVAIDPGSKASAYVVWDGKKILDFNNQIENKDLLDVLESYADDNHQLVIEKVEGFGMTAGETLFETVFWAGRFFQHWVSMTGGANRLGRKEIKRRLCGVTTAKDKDINEYMMMRFGEGDHRISHGTKKAPGPLYGIAGDGTAALAVALAWQIIQEEN